MHTYTVLVVAVIALLSVHPAFLEATATTTKAYIACEEKFNSKEAVSSCHTLNRDLDAIVNFVLSYDDEVTGQVENKTSAIADRVVAFCLEPLLAVSFADIQDLLRQNQWPIRTETDIGELRNGPVSFFASYLPTAWNLAPSEVVKQLTLGAGGYYPIVIGTSRQQVQDTREVHSSLLGELSCQRDGLLKSVRTRFSVYQTDAQAQAEKEYVRVRYHLGKLRALEEAAMNFSDSLMQNAIAVAKAELAGAQSAYRFLSDMAKLAKLLDNQYSEFMHHVWYLFAHSARQRVDLLAQKNSLLLRATMRQ